MKTGSLLSVSIRVHPWLDHIGCGFAAFRCIAELYSAGRGMVARVGLSQRFVEFTPPSVLSPLLRRGERKTKRALKIVAACGEFGWNF
jgi:hypothetical protein